MAAGAMIEESGAAGAGGRSIGRLVAAAAPAVYWTDRPGRPVFGPAPSGRTSADLVVVGAGFTGLWAAHMARRRDPGRRIVVLEAGTVGDGASTRNGGFCDASLTHGLGNGVSHWPDEMPSLLRLGDENLDGLLRDLDELGLGRSARRVETIEVAVADWQERILDDLARIGHRFGRNVLRLDRTGVGERLRSPTHVGGLLTREGKALVDPGAVAWGLAETAAERDVEILEETSATGIRAERHRLVVETGSGAIDADRVIVATNAWAGPGRSMRRRIVPVYDHVLMTEPLSAAQHEAIGWQGSEGLSDVGNQFHYYRKTDDGRILWGGYDANYHFGSRVEPAHERRRASFELLAGHFFNTFPQLTGLGFSHRWAGPIGTTSRFTAAWGREHDGRLAWVGGYTGLGVAASRFGAAVALDLVDGRQTERTELAMVRRKPFPFPPEPLRWSAIRLTRRALVRADSREGRRGPLLRVLDRFGVGFDS